MRWILILLFCAGCFTLENQRCHPPVYLRKGAAPVWGVGTAAAAASVARLSEGSSETITTAFFGGLAAGWLGALVANLWWKGEHCPDDRLGNE